MGSNSAIHWVACLNQIRLDDHFFARSHVFRQSTCQLYCFSDGSIYLCVRGVQRRSLCDCNNRSRVANLRLGGLIFYKADATQDKANDN
jgi:hypothetical protein